MTEVFPTEGIFTLAGSNTVEQLTTDNNIYFQQLWLYPGKAVSGSTGKLTANTAAVFVGLSGPAISFTPDSLTFDGSVALVTEAAHGLTNGASIKVTGSTPSAYNGTFPIRNVTPNSFEYQLASQPSGPATTLPTIARAQYCPQVIAQTDTTPFKIVLPLGQKMRLSQVILDGGAGDGVFYQFT